MSASPHTSMPTLPSTYRRAVIHAPGQFRLDEVPTPSPGRGEVLVRVHATAVCTWEQRVFAGTDTSSYPLVGGHEIAAEVVAVGTGVEQPLAPGDLVAVSHLRRCGECRSCRRGYDNICDREYAHREPGQPWGPGGFAEYLMTRSDKVYRYEQRVPPQEAALTEPLSCVVHDVKRFAPRRDDCVVIVGGGIMGLLHLLLLRGTGATLILSEPHPLRRQKALALGAHHVVDPSTERYVDRILELTGGRGADVTYLAVGTPELVEQAVQATAKRGVVSLYASVHPKGTPVRLDPNVFHNKEVLLSGSMSSDRGDFQEAVNLIGQRRVDLRPLISATFPLERLHEAFAAARQPEGYRVFVTADATR